MGLIDLNLQAISTIERIRTFDTWFRKPQRSFREGY